jgi:hypothetical protein
MDGALHFLAVSVAEAEHGEVVLFAVAGKQTKHGIFAVIGRSYGDAHVHARAVREDMAKTTVLGCLVLVGTERSQHFYAGNDLLMDVFREGFEILENAIKAEADPDTFTGRVEVDIRGI